jgi:S-adenosylmethionine synthetase
MVTASKKRVGSIASATVVMEPIDRSVRRRSTRDYQKTVISIDGLFVWAENKWLKVLLTYLCERKILLAG